MHDAFLFFFTVMFLCMANFCLTLQEDKLQRPLSDMESWKLARERSRRKEGESQYYGKTEEHLGSYIHHYQEFIRMILLLRSPVSDRRHGGGGHPGEEEWPVSVFRRLDHSFDLVHTASG